MLCRQHSTLWIHLRQRVCPDPIRPTIKPNTQADVGPTWKQPQLQLQQLAAGNNSKATSTDPVQVHDTDTQTTERCDAGCQASTSGRTSSAGAGQQRGRGADPHMPAFLQRVAPSMLAALSANSEALGAGVRGRPAGATYSNSMSKEVCVDVRKRMALSRFSTACGLEAATAAVSVRYAW